MNHLEELISLSKYAGERFDLIQAGGGNASVKQSNNIMLIKSSGYALSEMSKISGYTKLDTQKVISILESEHLRKIKNKREKNQLASQLLQEAVLSHGTKPSIETFFHVLLDTYVLHTHPIVVNVLTCNSSWKSILQKLFPKSLCLNYYTPGIELALALQEEFRQSQEVSSVIFLQNHGLIVHGHSKKDVIDTTERVLNVIEKELKIPQTPFKITTQLSKLINSIDETQNNISFLSQDETINRTIRKKKSILFSKPLSPDFVVYCGFHAIELADLNDPTPLITYKNKYCDLPKIIIYKEQVFCIAQNIKKAKQIEGVFKAHLLTTTLVQQTLHHLPTQEQKFITTWDDEKYRKSLGA